VLTQIQIRDYAIVDGLELDLGPGMSALTGETGAGKSILVDALGLVLGDRADSTSVRHGAARAEISASFDLSDEGAVLRWLVEHDLDAGDSCVLRRVIAADGRSRAYINGSTTTLQALRELGEQLVEIHGQHEHQRLLHRSAQRELLDAYGGCAAARAATAEACAHWQALQTRMQALASAASERSERMELLRFQLEELQALGLRPGEAQTLDEEQRRLAHAEQLLAVASGAHEALYAGEEASIDRQLGLQLARLQDAERLDPSLAEPRALLEEARTQMREAAQALGHYAQDVELDPARLAEVETRLATLLDLARKHRVEPGEVAQHHTRLAEEYAALEASEEDAGSIEAALAEAAKAYAGVAADLTKARQAAARRLGAAVTEAMQGLGMEGGHFEVALVPEEDERPRAEGLERVEFQVTANPGQPVQPLAKVASGGELSRLSLALQLLASRRLGAGTLVFDEVDAGIGGAVAEVVGRQLRRLAAERQVLCVTHLPQVAAQAHQHLRVSKLKASNATRTRIDRLDERRRVEELARMLGGVEITDQSLAHAREMIGRAASEGQA
jgi:DNA repair protein RecN (Recombination protein N)